MAAKPKHAGGRPSKYRKRFCQDIIDFFSTEPFEDIEIPHRKGGEVVWTDITRRPNILPTLTQFARNIGVWIPTVYNWADPGHASYHKEFLDALTHARRIRKDFLIQNGLFGLYPPASFKFVAVNLTDMRDKTDTELSGEVRIPDVTIRRDSE